MRARSVVPERGAPIRKIRRSCMSERLRELVDGDLREAVVFYPEGSVHPRAEVLERGLDGELHDLALREVAAHLRELRVRDVVRRDRHHLGVAERHPLTLREA